MLRFCVEAVPCADEAGVLRPEAGALRSPEKRSVPFAADRESSALRDVGMGVETVFGCGRDAPVLAIVVMIPYYNKE